MDAADLAIRPCYFAGNGTLPADVNCDLNYDAAIDLTDLVWLQNEVGGTTRPGNRFRIRTAIQPPPG